MNDNGGTPTTVCHRCRTFAIGITDDFELTEFQRDLINMIHKEHTWVPSMTTSRSDS